MNDRTMTKLILELTRRFMRADNLSYDQAVDQASAQVAEWLAQYRAAGAPHGDDNMGLAIWLVLKQD